MESRVLVQSRHLKHLRCHSRPLARTCSAAYTTPPQRGQPLPGGAWIAAVSITVVLGAWSLYNRERVLLGEFSFDFLMKCLVSLLKGCLGTLNKVHITYVMK